MLNGKTTLTEEDKNKINERKKYMDGKTPWEVSRIYGKMNTNSLFRAKSKNDDQTTGLENHPPLPR